MSQINTTATVSATSGFGNVGFLACVWTEIVSARTELLLFVIAMAAYAALFRQRTPRSTLPAKKVKMFEECIKEEKENHRMNADEKGINVKPKGNATVAEKALQEAFENGDYRAVLRYWNAMKKFDKMPSISLSHVVESMQRSKKDTPFILQELTGFIKKFEFECDMCCINDLLESLAKRLDSELMEQIVEMLPSVNLKMNACSYEIFLNMYFTMRRFQEVEALASQMKACQIPFSARSSMVIIKTALKVKSFDEAVQSFRDFKNTLASSSSTPSMALNQIVSQLVELACKERSLSVLLRELHGLTISGEVLNTMLVECVRQNDSML